MTHKAPKAPAVPANVARVTPVVLNWGHFPPHQNRPRGNKIAIKKPKLKEELPGATDTQKTEIADENKAWIIKEPITTESWFYASLDILDGIKQFSESAIKVVTPENFNKARTTISMISGSVS